MLGSERKNGESVQVILNTDIFCSQIVNSEISLDPLVEVVTCVWGPLSDVNKNNH